MTHFKFVVVCIGNWLEVKILLQCRNMGFNLKMSMQSASAMGPMLSVDIMTLSWSTKTCFKILIFLTSLVTLLFLQQTLGKSWYDEG